MELSLSKALKLICLTISFIVTFLLSQTFAATGETQLQLEIMGGGLTIGNPANYNFGSVGVSVEDQIITGQFSDYFWLEDLEARDSGYFTTIQCNGLKSLNGNTLTGIYFKKNNLTKILGSENPRVQIQSVFSDYYLINQPVIYFYRNQATNYGIISKYGDIPFVKIIIPGGTPPGNYNGTITFTLYLN